MAHPHQLGIIGFTLVELTVAITLDGHASIFTTLCRCVWVRSVYRYTRSVYVYMRSVYVYMRSV